MPTFPIAAPPSSIFAGPGEMATRMREFDWASSPLGEPARWPAAFASAVGIVISARFPMAIYWGEEGWLFYNDAWRPILGDKHPWALGKAARDVWPEIWDEIAPGFDTVRRAGEATWSGDSLLPMQRFGYTEECYFDYTFNPIRGVDGKVEGILNVVQETTERVLSGRRTEFLRELSARTAAARSEVAAGEAAIAAFATDPADFPFTLLYLIDAPNRMARLVAADGVDPSSAAHPREIGLADESAAWPLGEAVRAGKTVLVDALGRRFGAAFRSPWPEPVTRALVVPIVGAAQEGHSAVLVAGVNPRRSLDSDYRRLLELTGSQLATGIATANSYASERRRAEQLAEIDRAKTVFFSNVSHEFRTPLTLMLGPLEEELRERGGSSARLDLAYRNSLRLLKLVNTLLDFSRIEAGRMDAEFEPVDLASWTAELASLFRSATDKAGLRLIVDCPPLPESVYVNREMWEKIVFNFISNAFKFTFEGEIEVGLHPAPPHHVKLVVRDTGVGIPADELPRIFERFHRVRHARSRSYEGTGIGLALVQELVRLHGGSVEVTSVEGRGSTFTATIPRGMAHLPPERIHASRRSGAGSTSATAYVEEAVHWLPHPIDAAAAGSPPALELPPGERPSRHRGARLLLADDNRDMREYVHRLLADRGFLVTSVADGDEAVAAALKEPPALVVSDVMMPGRDGFGVLHALRAEVSTRTVPVILLSARAGEEARIGGIEAGADDYLVKPFSARELLARVETHLELSRLRKESAAAIEQERRRLHALLMEAPALIVVLRGPQHVVELANEHWGRSIGRPDVGALVGKPLLEVVPELRSQGFLEVLDRVYATGEAFHGLESRVVIRPPGAAGPTEVFVNFVYQPMRNPAGEVDGILVHAVDVTEQVRSRREVEQLAAGLREANGLLEDRAAHLETLVHQRTTKLRDTIAELEAFSYSIAHDLRAPLRSLQGFSDVLLSEYAPQLPAEAQGFLGRIGSSAGRMDKLIQDVLSYSRIVRGELSFETVDLDRLVREIVETYPSFAPDKIEIVIPAALPRVSGNEAMFTQIFSNLIGNAQKFVAAGVKPRVEITCSVAGGHARIAVRDNGVGIAPEQHQRIFEMFQQLDKSYGGTGIGLAIVKKAVERMGGRIGVESQPGEGALFWIEVAAA
ncbi:MAG TPA: ATP-binding protein [Opitutaceae bacterium]|nr:ATP-binding protein [Opitutaceae bacterium]